MIKYNIIMHIYYKHILSDEYFGRFIREKIVTISKNKNPFLSYELFKTACNDNIELMERFYQLEKEADIEIKKIKEEDFQEEKQKIYNEILFANNSNEENFSCKDIDI